MGSREVELVVEEGLEVVTRTAMGLALKERVSERVSGSGRLPAPPAPSAPDSRPRDPATPDLTIPAPTPVRTPGYLAAVPPGERW